MTEYTTNLRNKIKGWIENNKEYNHIPHFSKHDFILIKL